MMINYDVNNVKIKLMKVENQKFRESKNSLSSEIKDNSMIYLPTQMYTANITDVRTSQQTNNILEVIKSRCAIKSLEGSPDKPLYNQKSRDNRNKQHGLRFSTQTHNLDMLKSMQSARMTNRNSIEMHNDTMRDPVFKFNNMKLDKTG
jgi:hypothetical protein